MRPRELPALAVVVALSVFIPVALAGSSTRIVGGSPAQQALLRQIVDGAAPTGIPDLHIVAAPGGVKLTAPTVELRATWETLVVGAAFFDRSAALGLPRVVEVDTLHTGLPTSNATGNEPTHATASTAATIRTTMLRLVEASGARPAEVTVSTPDAPAVAIRVRVKDAAWFMRRKLRRLVAAAGTHQSRYDGLLIEVDDAHGRAWADASTRLGGASYVRPKLRGCNPFPPPGLPGPLPACPG